ncbi:response regulator [Trueperella bialowiezensis]|uniref:Hydrogenase transcriptional regulatory protein hupR1 n=1 Tax=Trueperella bialowiezensis TaxID=312285 RepID=A0A448PE22_9ACTO|nr:response regulator [Trueperella bialowiezensis]VEI13179.1 Hydrogenase transcriptional regulatory protein hupR1 [Trueperella bialowiezensis]
MKLAILIVEDEPEVRTSIERDLIDFADHVRIEPAEDVADAWDVIDEIDADGDVVALALCDHRMPGTTGVDFLVEMMDDERTAMARKVLVTGQADLADTVRAVNDADLDHYIAKPWDPEDLRETSRRMLTDFVEVAGINPLPHLPVLDQGRAMELARHFTVAD